MLDFLSQIWLSITRRMLTYFMAILSLGMGVAAFVCLSAFNQSYLSNLAHRVNEDSNFSIGDGPIISMNIGFAAKHKEGKLDAEWINQQVRQVLGKEVAAMTTSTFDVKVGRHALKDMKVFAVSSNWLKLQPHFSWINDQTAGRALTSEDDRSGEAVCIIDQNLAEALPENLDPVGQMLKVNGMSFRIVGVVSDFNYGNYGVLFISFSAAQPLLRIQPPWSVSFLIKSDEKRIQSEIGEARNTVAHALGSDYEVSATCPWLDLEEARYQLTYTRLFLGVLSLLPLTVGLLGTVSMLLANLNNRVREIGLHRALGATRLRQASLVLCEAGFTGLLASLVGIPIGMAVLHMLSSAWGSELHIAPGGILVAVLSGTIAAVLAGGIPARAAMRISPAESLRAL